MKKSSLPLILSNQIELALVGAIDKAVTGVRQPGDAIKTAITSRHQQSETFQMHESIAKIQIDASDQLKSVKA